MILMETPTDSCGMPLLVLNPQRKLRGKTNKHHPWHPDDDLSAPRESLEDLNYEYLRLKSLRYSILELLPVGLHQDYHNHYRGPKLPETDTDTFFSVILGRAGYRTERVLDFRNGSPVEIDTTKAIAKKLKVFPDRAHPDAYGQDYRTRRTGMFLAQYALGQDLGHIDELKIEQFLASDSEETRTELGKFIIEEAIRVAVDPIVEKYRYALDQHRIPHYNGEGPFKVVTDIFKASQMPYYFDTLSTQLSNAA